MMGLKTDDCDIYTSQRGRYELLHSDHVAYWESRRTTESDFDPTKVLNHLEVLRIAEDNRAEGRRLELLRDRLQPIDRSTLENRLLIDRIENLKLSPWEKASLARDMGHVFHGTWRDALAEFKEACLLLPALLKLLDSARDGYREQKRTGVEFDELGWYPWFKLEIGRLFPLEDDDPMFSASFAVIYSAIPAESR